MDPDTKEMPFRPLRRRDVNQSQTLLLKFKTTHHSFLLLLYHIVLSIFLQLPFLRANCMDPGQVLTVRGTAVGAVLMFGRVGSVVGSNVAGRFLPVACDATVYGFTTLLFLCAGLSFLLPKNDASLPSR